MAKVENATVFERGESYYFFGDQQIQRSIVRLKNGILITFFIDYPNTRFYKSTDNGETWTEAFYISTTPPGSSIAYKDNTIYFVFVQQGKMKFLKIDFSQTVSHGDKIGEASTASLSGINGSVLSNFAIAVNPTNGYITVVFSAYSGPSGSGNNLYAVQSRNEGSSWRKHDGTSGVDRVDKMNYSSSTSINWVSIDAVYMKNGHVFVAAIPRQTVANRRLYIYNGSDFEMLVSSSNYQERNITTCVSPSGRLWVFSQDRETQSSPTRRLFYFYSDDNGVTWNTSNLHLPTVIMSVPYQQTIERLSATVDENGKVFLYFVYKVDSVFSVERLVWDNSWSSLQSIIPDMEASGYVNTFYDPFFATKFQEPLVVHTYSPLGKMYFSGDFESGPKIFANINGSWKPAESVFVRIGGSWKQVESIGARIGGSWKES